MSREPAADRVQRELEALDERKLRGEISDDDYATAREALLQTTLPAQPARGPALRLLWAGLGLVVALLLAGVVIAAVVDDDNDAEEERLVPATATATR